MFRFDSTPFEGRVDTDTSGRHPSGIFFDLKGSKIFMLEINAGSDRDKTTNAQQATCSPKIQAFLSLILSHFMNLTLIAVFFLKSVCFTWICVTA